MSTVVITLPPAVSLSDDPVWVRLNTDNFVVSAGTNASYTMDFDTGGVEDDTLTILISGADNVVFTCKDSPDRSGLQFYSQGAGTLENFVNNLYNALRFNYELSRMYEFTLSGDSLSITIDALEPGSDYTLAALPTGTLNYSASGIVAGVDAEYRENFHLNIEVYDENGLIENSQKESEPDSANTAEFNISDVLQSLVSTEFEYPEDSDELMVVRTECIKKYKFRYWESYGVPAANEKMYESSWYYVMKGRSAYMQTTEYHELNTSWWSNLLTSHKFLTLQPNYKKVGTSQVEKLFFLNHTDYSGDTILKVKLYFTDGTNTTEDIETLADFEKYQVIECCVGYSAMELADVSPTKTVEKYEVWLEQDSNQISEKRTYYVDLEYHKRVRYFLFSNSLCGYDTMRALGVGTSEAGYSTKKVSKELPYNYTSKHREFVQTEVEETRTFTAHFGVLNNISGDVYAADWMNYLRQIMFSQDRYEIINSRIVPIQSITEKVPLHNDKSKIYGFMFTYERDFIDEAYSDDEIPIDPDYNDDYNDDYLT